MFQMKKHIFVTALLCCVFITPPAFALFDEPSLSEDQIAINEVKSFVYETNNDIENVARNIEARFNQVWYNPKISAKKFFEILGTQGGKVFRDSWEWQLIAKKHNPNFQFLVPPLPYTINEDDSVTVHDAPEPEPTPEPIPEPTPEEPS